MVVVDFSRQEDCVDDLSTNNVADDIQIPVRADECEDVVDVVDESLDFGGEEEVIAADPNEDDGRQDVTTEYAESDAFPTESEGESELSSSEPESFESEEETPPRPESSESDEEPPPRRSTHISKPTQRLDLQKLGVEGVRVPVTVPGQKVS